MRAPVILASIDMRDLVVRKINGLDIEEVERLLLQVIQRHLQYINILGGLLGGLIGLIQDLVCVIQFAGRRLRRTRYGLTAQCLGRTAD